MSSTQRPIKKPAHTITEHFYNIQTQIKKNISQIIGPYKGENQNKHYKISIQKTHQRKKMAIQKHRSKEKWINQISKNENNLFKQNKPKISSK